MIVVAVVAIVVHAVVGVGIGVGSSVVRATVANTGGIVEGLSGENLKVECPSPLRLGSGE